MSASRYIAADGARRTEVGGPSLSIDSPGTLVVYSHPRPNLNTSIGLSASGSFWLTITSVQIESEKAGDEVTTDDLRNVRVIELIRENLPKHVSGSALHSARQRTPGALPETVRDAWPSQSAMWEVAHTYNFARAVRMPPVKAVVDAYEISRSTAHRWINQCRDAGMISGG